MNSNAADIVADHFAFARVQPRADFDTEGPDFISNGARTTYSAGRTVEGSKKAVAGRFDLMATKVHEIAPDRGVMIVKEVAPAAVAKRGSLWGGANYVRKEHRGEHPVDRDSGSRARQKLLDCIGNLFDVFADPGWMVLSRKLDIASVGNVLGKITSTFHVDGYISLSMDDKRRHPDCRDDVADVYLTVHLHECGDRSRAGTKSLKATPPFLGDRIVRK